MTQAVEFEVPRFSTAVEQGEVVEQSGYHQMNACACTPTTRSGKGAYRDVVVDLPDGTRVHYYHQHPVVAVDSTRRFYRLDSCGFKTLTTKERINDATPRGIYVRQRDFTWYVEVDDDEREFDDRMVVEAPR